MNMRVKGIVLGIFVFSLLFSFSPLLGQVEQVLNQANIHYKNGNYHEAIIEYEKVLEADRNNVYINIQLARCYVLSYSKNKALKYALQAKKLSAVQPSGELCFIIARAYHINNSFDSAIYYYQKSGSEKISPHMVSKYVNECKNGKKYIEDRVSVDIINIGKPVNSEFPEFMPFISADKSKLFYTAARPSSDNIKKDKDGMYFEDIFFSNFSKGQWQSPHKIYSLSSDGHDACAGISEDGMIMFVYRGTNNGDLYISELKGYSWTIPEKFPHNTNGFEGSASLSPDGKTLYYVHQPLNSDNRDIYKCTRTAEGKWEKPSKIVELCTEYDEDCPFIHPDGRTLYFSSKGHTSMGGYDIFSSFLENNLKWSSPKNIGFPINTAGDDINFTLSADGQTGFYSSDREGGYGNQDIYSIKFKERIFHDLGLLVGNILDASSGKPMEAEITITDNSSNEVLGTFRSNAEDGHFVVALPCGRNYGIHIENKGYLFFSENAKLECAKGYLEISKNIPMQHIQSGSKIVLSNIFFD
jgi:tetratricopeptide (TPR) repeat protein